MTLISASADDVISFVTSPFDIWRQPQRPGELTELIDVQIGHADEERISRRAVHDLPFGLALYIGIEAARSLNEAVEVTGVDRETLIAVLDSVADETPMRGPQHWLARPLSDYADAVTKPAPRNTTAAEEPAVRVPSRVAAIWAHTAAQAGLPLDTWIGIQLEKSFRDCTHWEAAAARTGRTLSEWILVQAARCARSTSVVPHRTASI